MIFKDFWASENDDGRRLDRILSRIMPASAHDPFPKLLRKNLIRLNDKKADIGDHVSTGDKISIALFLLPEDKDSSLQDKEIPQKHTAISFETVFENPDIKIINKPYGINVQPSEGSVIDLSSIIKDEYESSRGKDASLSFTPGALHRLDRNTTGLLAFSQSLKGAQWFSKAISSHEIKKTYVAVAEGILAEAEEWKDYLKDNRDSTSPFHTVKVTSKNDGSLAITRAYPIKYGKYKNKDVTLIQLNIETGRKHQIRCQSAFHGHPLIGDKSYGSSVILSGHEFFLHAIRLKTPENNPIALPSELQAPLPLDFKQILEESLIKWDGKLII